MIARHLHRVGGALRIHSGPTSHGPLLLSQISSTPATQLSAWPAQTPGPGGLLCVITRTERSCDIYYEVWRKGFGSAVSAPPPYILPPRNMLSALQHPEVERAYLTKECALGRMLGPFPLSVAARLPPLHVNRFGVIPKGHNTGKWRLITDLSYPSGCSVNDGIDPDLCSLSYSSVEQVATVTTSYLPGTLLAKIDIDSAYRLIPVHPSDRPLQAMEWDGMLYVDPMLPFGLRSAPKIFNAVADALEWCIRAQGVQHIFHYLDDFIVIGPPNSATCAEALTIIDQTCNRLGVPMVAHKREGPTTRLTYLGIEVDTVAGQLRLPSEKLHRLQTLLREWGDRKVCTCWELESLIGTLNHACKVVQCGRSFLGDCSTSSTESPPAHHVITANFGQT